MLTDGRTDGQTDGRTDDGRKVITIAHPEHISGELKKKKKNSQKLQRAITPTKFHITGCKFNQVISSSVPISIPNIKALAPKVFEIILLTRFQCYFIKRATTLKWEKIRIRKNRGHLFFFMRNPYIKFQNISIHSSKLMQCT